MVAGLRHICSVMTHRFNPERPATRLNTFRDMAEDLMTRSQMLLKRNEHRSQTAIYTVRLDSKWTSKKARVISVIVFAFCVSFSAVIMGIYYAYFYHPKTDRLFAKHS